MLKRRRIVLLLAMIAALSSTAGGEEKPTNADQFEINNDGDGLLVPIKIGNDVRLFLVDTGSSITIFDSKLLRGDPVETARFVTAGSDISVPKYEVPAASLGSLRLKNELSCVGALDLQELRNHTGLDFYGILGMDFLRHFIVEIDFENRKLIVGRTSAIRPGVEKVPLIYDQSSLPFVSGRLHGWSEAEFLVDTGQISHDSGTIETRTAQYLTRLGHLQGIGNSKSATAGGTIAENNFQAHSLKVGAHEILNPIFSDGNQNSLSVRYFSRYSTVILDFPEQCIYWQKNAAFNDPDARNLSGMHLKRENLSTIVDSIDPNSAAEQAGIKSGDVILAMNDRVATRVRLYELECLMGQFGSTLTLKLVRGEEKRNASIQLK